LGGGAHGTGEAGSSGLPQADRGPGPALPPHRGAARRQSLSPRRGPLDRRHRRRGDPLPLLRDGDRAAPPRSPARLVRPSRRAAGLSKLGHGLLRGASGALRARCRPAAIMTSGRARMSNPVLSPVGPLTVARAAATPSDIPRMACISALVVLAFAIPSRL